MCVRIHTHIGMHETKGESEGVRESDGMSKD